MSLFLPQDAVQDPDLAFRSDFSLVSFHLGRFPRCRLSVTLVAAWGDPGSYYFVGDHPAGFACRRLAGLQPAFSREDVCAPGSVTDGVGLDGVTEGLGFSAASHRPPSPIFWLRNISGKRV